MEEAMKSPEHREGLTGLDEKVSPTRLILQRLEDLAKRMDSMEQTLHKRMDQEFGNIREGIRTLCVEVRREIASLRGEINSVRGEVNSVRGEVGSLRNWSLGLLLLAILGLLAKLLISGA